MSQVLQQTGLPPSALGSCTFVRSQNETCCLSVGLVDEGINCPPLSQFGRRLLAEGDSWFTIGTLNLPEASNILFKLELTVTTAIVNCAYPGDTLQHMVDNVNDPYFDRLLCRKRFSSYWEAILISAGGNDLIDATQVGPLDRNGIRVPIDQRLLLTPDEASQNLSATGPDRYISEGGWHRLAKYLQTNFRELTQRRDKGPSKGRPLFTHTYSIPTIRPSGTLGNPRGWLYPALAAFDIPDASRQGVTSALFGRLRMLLLGHTKPRVSPRHCQICMSSTPLV